MNSHNLLTNYDEEIDDDNQEHYNSARPTEDKNKITGTVRNRKTKFGSFQSVLKFKRTIEIDTNLESETECQDLNNDIDNTEK